MKSRAYVEYAVAKGVEWFVIDSVEELQRCIALSPTAKPTCASTPPMSAATGRCHGKFGAYESEIRDIIAEAARLGADLAGVTFHVGSQCLNPENWKVGLKPPARCSTRCWPPA